MKYAALLMAALVVCAAAVGVFTYVNARLQVVSVSLETLPAAQRESDFASLQAAMDNGALSGTPFTAELPGGSGDYSFFTYTFRLKNKGLLNAEMVEIQLLPANGDVLCYSSLASGQINQSIDVPAGEERDAWCVLLTSAQNQEAQSVARSFRITYYIWGIPMSVNAAYQ